MTAAVNDGAIRFVREQIVLNDDRPVGAALAADPWLEQQLLAPVFALDDRGLPRYRLVYLELSPATPTAQRGGEPAPASWTADGNGRELLAGRSAINDNVNGPLPPGVLEAPLQRLSHERGDGSGGELRRQEHADLRRVKPDAVTQRQFVGKFHQRTPLHPEVPRLPLHVRQLGLAARRGKLRRREPRPPPPQGDDRTAAPGSTCEHASVTSQGSAHGRFSHAIQRRDLWEAEVAAREMGGLALDDTLDLVALIAETRPEKLDSACGVKKFDSAGAVLVSVVRPVQTTRRADAFAVPAPLWPDARARAQRA